MQILTLAKQMYPGQTGFCLNQYEKAVKRPFGYLLIYVKTTTQDNCRQQTNVLPSEGGFNQVGFQENIPQELLKYLSSKIFRLSRFFQLCKNTGKLDDVLSRNDSRDDGKAKRYFHLQKRYLAFK